METQRIASLRLGVLGFPIEIRALRIWKPRFRPNDTCIMFVDRYGDTIQAIAHGKDQKSVEARISVGMCYRIEGYACSAPQKHVNMLSHPINMRIGQASSISPIPDTDGLPRQHFNFTSHEHLQEICGNDDETTDYYGILQQIEDKTTRAGRPFVNLTLLDASDKEIKATLWEEIATAEDRFDRAAIENSPYPAVIAVTSMKVLPYLSDSQLYSTTSSYVYLNPKVSATETIITRFNSKNEPGTDAGHQHNNSCSSLVTTGQHNTTLGALLQKQDQELNGKTFLFDAVVSEVLETVDWYYNACPTCLQTIYKSDDDWWCPLDGNHSSAKFMYRITAILADDTYKVTTTLFDDAVKNLVGIDCSEFRIIDACSDIMTIPPQILAIAGKKKKFHVQAYRATRSGTLRATVNKVSDPDAPPNLPIVQHIMPPPTPRVTTAKSPSHISTSVKRALYQISDAETTAPKKGKHEGKKIEE